ncbi:tyrosine-type recombinase/integrase [Aeoliella sp.]|uniref:tyrosine-type recombinase/integrase n=1 Tax=Aeoliella sp. TaxID=2795800 RepID=UPI003CCC0AF2
MNSEIKVYVIDKGRKYWYMKYTNPLDGSEESKSTKCSDYNNALKAAAKWEADLQEGRYERSSRMSWERFISHYTENALGDLAAATSYGYLLALEKFSDRFHPKKLGDLTTPRITSLVTKLRAEGLSEASIASVLRGLKRAARWAHGEGLLTKIPSFKMPKSVRGQKRMKGRPVTAEEFERMEQAAKKVIGAKGTASWRFYLRGLWESGLRLGESLKLSWDDRPGAIVVDFAGRRPLLRIPGAAQKKGTDQLLPITPEFARHLETVPEPERRGWVFRPLDDSGEPYSRSRHAVGPVVTRIGKKAGVVVDERTKWEKDEEGNQVDVVVRKFASAHDLRRGFGFRWSRRVMPPVLQELMRHASIQTTMEFYVGQNAESTADELWRAAESQSVDFLVDTRHKPTNRAEGQEQENP